MPLTGFDPHAGATPALSEWQRQLIGLIPYLGTVYNFGRGATALYRTFNPQTYANLTLPQNDPDYGNPNYIGLGTPVPDNGQNDPNAPSSNPPPNTPEGNVAGARPTTAPGYMSVSPGLLAYQSYGQGTYNGYGGATPLQAGVVLRSLGYTPSGVQDSTLGGLGGGGSRNYTNYSGINSGFSNDMMFGRGGGGSQFITGGANKGWFVN